jgi:hypothetical protein
VGSRQFNSFGSHAAAEYVKLIHFPTLEACCCYLKDVAGACVRVCVCVCARVCACVCVL